MLGVLRRKAGALPGIHVLGKLRPKRTGNLNKVSTTPCLTYLPLVFIKQPSFLNLHHPLPLSPLITVAKGGNACSPKHEFPFQLISLFGCARAASLRPGRQVQPPFPLFRPSNLTDKLATLTISPRRIAPPGQSCLLHCPSSSRSCCSSTALVLATQLSASTHA